MFYVIAFYKCVAGTGSVEDFQFDFVKQQLSK